MTEALLLEWYRKDREWIEQGETLFTLESEKSVIEIEAPTSGYVKILIPEGDTVPVMTPVAMLYPDEPKEGDIIETAQAPQVESTKKEDLKPKVSKEILPSVGLRATPKARHLARQRGLTLTNLTGSGPRGMIVSADLKNIPLQQTVVQATPVARKMAKDCGLDLATVIGTGPGGRITREDVTDALAKSVQDQPKEKTSLSQALEGLRGVIAERLTLSWNERPQVTLLREVDATNMIAAREKLAIKNGKISFNAFLVLAAAKALMEQPHVNVRLTDRRLEQLDEINVGLAVDTDRGLMVPVLRQTEKKSLSEVNDDLSDLVERTLASKLLPDEYSDGSFTITNLGSFGVDAFTPIINPPEVAILGVGRIEPKPVAIERKLEVRDMFTLSLSFDHRLIDGAPAAKFLHKIVELIENPDKLT